MSLSNQFFFFIIILFAGMFSLPQTFLQARNINSEKAHEEIIKQYKLTTKSGVKISNIPFGAILILPIDSDTAEIRVLRTAATEAELACNKIKIEALPSSLIITGNNNGECRLQNTGIEQNIVIKLPRKTNIEADTITGPLRIGEIEGRGPNYISGGKGNKVLQPADRQNIIGKGFDGAVNIRSISGAVKLVQGIGYSNVSGVSGPIEITVRRLGAQGLTVNGTNNSVAVTFGAGLNSILEMSDIRGRIINKTGAALNTEGKKFRSQIGSGGNGSIILISSVNGDVIVNREH